jgi:hypothetical protein
MDEDVEKSSQDDDRDKWIAVQEAFRTEMLEKLAEMLQEIREIKKQMSDLKGGQ